MSMLRSDRAPSRFGDERSCDDTIQAGAEATQAGMMTAKAVTHAGTWTTMASGFAGLVVGILLGLIIVKS